MSATMNLTGNAYYSVAGGFPFRLISSGDSLLSGVVPKLTSTVVASVQAESGTADVHMGIFTMPMTSGGNDNAIVLQVDSIGVDVNGETLTLTVPDQTTSAPTCYVLRLWCDNVSGSSAETVSRDGPTSVANLPRIPTGVLVNSVQVT